MPTQFKPGRLITQAATADCGGCLFEHICPCPAYNPKDGSLTCSAANRKDDQNVIWVVDTKDWEQEHG